MNKNGKNKKIVIFSLIGLLIFAIFFGITVASYNNKKARIAENKKNNIENIDGNHEEKTESTINETETTNLEKVSKSADNNGKDTTQSKNIVTKENKNENIIENRNSKITKEQAEKIVQGQGKKQGQKLSYINIEKVPYEYIETPYKSFPSEILDKEVYVFELAELVDKSSNEYVAICRYYVDFKGGLYKDTYFMNLECVKIK